MKRDMDLVRDLLLAVEAIPPGESRSVSDLVDDLHPRGTAEVAEHIRLMASVDLVEFVDMSDMDGFDGHLLGLTWNGSDVLDAIRSEGAMGAVRATIAEYGAVPLEVVKAIGIAWLKDRLKLGE